MEQTKECSKCKVVKPLSGFHKGKIAKLGIRHACKSCSSASQRVYYAKNRERVRGRYKKYYKENPAKMRDFALRKNYGINPEWIKGQLKQQLSQCAICGEPIDEKTLNVDHCHSSWKVRGLLCRYCNLGLGKFKDNTEFLYNAIEYLKTSRLDGRGDKTIQGSHYHEASFWKIQVA